MKARQYLDFLVNCRIGSLEIWEGSHSPVLCVNCRIGSLEMLHRYHRTAVYS